MNAIAFLGPESTGKTSWAIRYCEQYQAIYVEEFAREYLKDINLNYSEDDILQIAKGQIEKEKSALQKRNGQTIVFDTELITMEIWLEFYNFKVPSWISEHIQSCNYVYFLFDTDLPWVYDGLRNNPNDRSLIFELFEKKLSHYKKEYKIIRSLEDLDIR